MGNLEIHTSGEQSPGVVLGDFVVNRSVVQQFEAIRQKRWRPLGTGLWSILAEVTDEVALGALGSDMATALYELYGHARYTEFAALMQTATTEINDQRMTVYIVTSHKAALCQRVEYIHKALLDRMDRARQSGQYQEEKKRVADQWERSPVHKWQVIRQLGTGRHLQPVSLIIDSDTRRVSVRSVLAAATNISDYPEHIKRTSELLVWIGALASEKPGFLGDVGWINEDFRLTKLFCDMSDKKSVDLRNVRVNVDDDEEWDYLNPALDAEIRGFS